MDSSPSRPILGSDEHAPEPAAPALPGWAAALLRVPLFWKLLLANMALVAAVGAAALWSASRIAAPPVPTAAVAGFAVVVGAALASALVVRLALRPIDALSATARTVRTGDWSARAPASALADRRLERLRRVFNDMLDAVSESRRRQRDLSRRVLEAEERERERIAHELYAGTAQTLAGVLVRLEVNARSPDPGADLLGEITSEVRQALEEIRAVARRLRPPELDELGVGAALEAHARRLVEGHDIRIEFHGVVPEPSLSEPSRLALFRIAQEGLTNAVTHAHARVVRTRFAPALDGFVMEIDDDGRGFDPSETPPHGAGLGITGMEERARYAAGSFTVSSAPGGGTRLRLVLPWSAPGETGAEPAAMPRVIEMMPAGVPT